MKFNMVYGMNYRPETAFHDPPQGGKREVFSREESGFD